MGISTKALRIKFMIVLLAKGAIAPLARWVIVPMTGRIVDMFTKICAIEVFDADVAVEMVVPAS